MDDYAIMPYTAYRKQFGTETAARRAFGGEGGVSAMIAVAARVGHQGRGPA